MPDTQLIGSVVDRAGMNGKQAGERPPGAELSMFRLIFNTFANKSLYSAVVILEQHILCLDTLFPCFCQKADFINQTDQKCRDIVSVGNSF